MTKIHFIPTLALLLAIALQSCSHRTSDSTPTTSQSDDPVIEVAEGFEVEELYHPTADSLGSWVSITTDEQGRLIASAQSGYLYRFAPPAPGEQLSLSDIERIELEIGHAQGLLWAFNSLYVSVNSKEGVDGRGSGFYRLTDTDGDDRLDRLTLIQSFEGYGEHGPHAIRLSPDGQSLFLIAGNHTLIPDHFTSRLPKNWDEDNLFPPFKDARGHAAHIKAPGGWIAQTDPEGKEWEVFSTGYRNPYDMDFNAAGELFVFDSDMEWDLGTPWYRPIRVCHAVSGSDFGWRTGSGKWPTYYPDNLPPVVNVGQGSPTGVLMGTGAAFPKAYQQALFIFDWSFGTMYRVALSPDGSTYEGELEEFLSGVPLPIADGVIGGDGAMYVVSGGRGLDSRLLRITYSGPEDTGPITPDNRAGEDLRALRQALEAFHNRRSPKAVPTAWPHLNHEDRFVRYAARVAIEHQPLDQWASRALSEKQPERLIQAMVALARQGEAKHQPMALQALSGIDYAALPLAEQLNLLRAYGLLFIRMGAPSDAWRQRISQQLSPHFPADHYALNRELSQLLVYLGAPGAIEKTLQLVEQEEGEEAAGAHPTLISAEVAARDLERYSYGDVINEMNENRPPTQDMYYIKTLSYQPDGWTLEQRQRYFQWFYEALNKRGGASYKGFLEQFRLQALDNVPADVRPQLAEIAGSYEPGAVNLAELPQPEGPGKNYNPSDFGFLSEALKERRDFEQGQRMYQAALCQTCHQMRGEGGNIGPDLTQLATRFSQRDIVHAVLSPSDAITDQYAATQFNMKDGSTVIGRIVEETDSEIFLNQNPYDPQQQLGIAKADIASRSLSPVSIMPPGLFNRLNEEEIADLMAYLLAGGDPSHELFQ